MESNYAEENLPTKQPPPRQKARVSGKDGDKERPSGSETSAGKGTQTPDAAALLGFGLPKEARLLKRAEFLRVYEQGVRIEGRFMTVFFLPSKAGRHRLGVTATRKAIGKAHDRNRAKRLLRETFRLSRTELDTIDTKYDWVLNARRPLVRKKLEKPLAEFRDILKRITAGKK